MTALSDIWLRLPSPGIDELKRLGISFNASQKVGGLRASYVRYDDRHLKALVTRPEPATRSEPALIVPVYIDPPSIWRAVDDIVLIDLVALDSQNPDRWQTACGEGVNTYTGNVTISQTGDSFSATWPGGSVSGSKNRCSISGFGGESEDRGVSYGQGSGTISADGRAMSISGSWTWSDGVDACSGSSIFTLNRP